MRTKPSPRRAGNLSSLPSPSSQAASGNLEAGRSQAVATPYVPTEIDRTAAREHLRKRQRRPPQVRMKIKQDGTEVALGNSYPDPTVGDIHLMAALGVADSLAYERLAGDLANLATKEGAVSERHLNQLLGIVREIGPRDAIETMLAVQMVAIHSATITAVRYLAVSTSLPQQDSFSSLSNKLARTFAAQVETLKRYRSDGQQTIKVQHVTVANGGQAIVGDVHAEGGGTAKKAHQPHGPSATDERGPALLSNEQAIGIPLPSAGIEGLEGVPLSRGKRRGASRRG